MDAGNVVAYPTEAVWGLGCNPFDADAVAKVLALKQRSASKGLILVASCLEQFAFILEGLSQSHIHTLQQSWPGPHTWLVPCGNNVPYWISGEHDSVALRVSQHPVVQALCHTYGGPIVSTSANPQGKTAATSHWRVLQYFRTNPLLSYCVQGMVGNNTKPSSIRDLISGKRIR